MNVQTQSEISTEGASKPIKKVRAIDMFCGAGGSSWGARVAGVEIVAGFDMWDLAQSVYCDNFPEAKFYGKKLEELDPNKISKELGEIDLIIAY